MMATSTVLVPQNAFASHSSIHSHIHTPMGAAAVQGAAHPTGSNSVFCTGAQRRTMREPDLNRQSFLSSDNPLYLLSRSPKSKSGWKGLKGFCRLSIDSKECECYSQRSVVHKIWIIFFTSRRGTTCSLLYAVCRGDCLRVKKMKVFHLET